MPKKKKPLAQQATIVQGELLPTLVIDWSDLGNELMNRGWVRGPAIPVNTTNRVKRKPVSKRRHGKDA